VNPGEQVVPKEIIQFSLDGGCVGGARILLSKRFVTGSRLPLAKSVSEMRERVHQ
jgi:hypothetical protein